MQANRLIRKGGLLDLVSRVSRGVEAPLFDSCCWRLRWLLLLQQPAATRTVAIIHLSA